MYSHRFAVQHSQKLFEVSSICLDTLTEDKSISFCSDAQLVADSPVLFCWPTLVCCPPVN